MSEGFQALSEREKETLRLLLGGHDIKSIASGLGLSVHTVNERLREARRKLGASSSRQAARILAEAEQGSHSPGPSFSGPSFSGVPHFSADRQSGVAGSTAGAADHEPSYRTPGRGQSLTWLAGAMLIMSLIIAAAVVSLVLQGSGKAPFAPTRIAATTVAPAASESAGAARDWLKLVDGQHWDQGWAGSGELVRSHISQAQWVAAVQPVRQPLGAVTSRVLKTVTRATSLPGAPDGQYEVLQFATDFSQRPGMIETVALAHEGSAWKVDGYY